MDLRGKIAIVTGACSGIGKAVVDRLAGCGTRKIVLVDINQKVYEHGLALRARTDVPFEAFCGDVTDGTFRQSVFGSLAQKGEIARIFVPAAGITMDGLSVKIDKETGQAMLYPYQDFIRVLETNLVAPAYWAMEMASAIAQDRRKRGLKDWQPQEDVEGSVVFVGSVSSKGNIGQVAYAATKSGISGTASTLAKEWRRFGIRCGVIHPGYTDTPMVQAVPQAIIEKKVLPQVQIGRLIRPDEVAEAICYMLSNEAASREQFVDGGYAPAA
jgi:NAD(P)-dependent dehydrogenase (short-subunit alcohol dehydrogenase family)